MRLLLSRIALIALLILSAIVGYLIAERTTLVQGMFLGIIFFSGCGGLLLALGEIGSYLEKAQEA